MAQWYCTIGGQQHGPIDTNTLKAWAKEGRIKPTDMVWREGLANWAPASHVKGLFDNPGAPAPAATLHARPAQASSPPVSEPAAPTAYQAPAPSYAPAYHTPAGPLGKRPGGLTAMGVLNFVFGGGGVLMLVIVFAALDATSAASQALFGEGIGSRMPAGVVVSIILWVLVLGLLLASGVGYLTQNKIMGFGLGLAYGGLSIIHTIIGLILSEGEAILLSLLFLVYPILTLILLPTVFRRSFFRPRAYTPVF